MTNIIGTLPNNIQNGQTVDANPVMADFNFIVNQVNANGVNLTALSNNTGPAYGASLVGFDSTTLQLQLLSRINRTVDSIAALRLLSSSTYTRVTLTGYYTSGDKPPRQYWANPADVTSTDNGGTIIVSSADSMRWYMANDGVVTTKDFGAYANGSTDDAAAINAALAAGVATVEQHGSSAISSYILVPANTAYNFAGGGKLVALNNMPAYAPWGAAGSQGQMIFLNGSYATCSGAVTDGAGFKAGGIATFTYSYNSVSNLFANTTGTAQGLLCTGSNYLVVDAPKVTQCNGSAIELWQCSKSEVNNPIVDLAATGGVFMTDCASTNVNGGVITNCGDVGADIEGGINCAFNGTVVSACNNGEASWFANGTGSGRVPVACSFNGLTLTRAATYLAYSPGSPNGVSTACNTSAGAIQLSSITAGQEAIVYTGCNVYCAAGMTALYANDLGASNCGIVIKGGSITSQGQLFNLNRAYNLIVQDVTFRGLGASSAQENIWKNGDLAIFDDCDFSYESVKNTNYAVRYYTDLAITNSPTMSNCRFHNCGAFALLHDPFVSGVPLRITANSFSDSPQVNGGVDATANGRPLWRAQEMSYLIQDGTSTPAVNLTAISSLISAATVATGTLGVVDGSMNSYSVIYNTNGQVIKSYDGSGSGSGSVGGGVSTSRYASFSGAVISITGVDAGTFGVLDLVLNTKG